MRYWIAPHLAFLVQWLRVLGLDVRLWDKGVILGQGEEESIVQWDRYPLPLGDLYPLLHGDRYPLPLTHPGIPVISLSASTREDLLKEFFFKTGSRPDPSRMFKRCLRCNNLLISLTPDEARKKWSALPVYVFQNQKTFNWCDHCQQLFWAGTHVRNMIRTLEDWGIISVRKGDEVL